MQDQLLSPPALGTVREFACSRCSKSQQQRQHVYGEYRTWRQVDRFWECTTCRYQKKAVFRGAVHPPNLDLETERLHDQWREDNEKLRVTPRQQIQ